MKSGQSHRKSLRTQTPWMSVQEAANRLQVSRMTIYRYLDQGFLEKWPSSSRLTRVTRHSLENLFCLRGKDPLLQTSLGREEVVPVRCAAQELKVSPSTIYRRIEEGRLDYVSNGGGIGGVTRESLKYLLNS